MVSVRNASEFNGLSYRIGVRVRGLDRGLVDNDSYDKTRSIVGVDSRDETKTGPAVTTGDGMMPSRTDLRGETWALSGLPCW